MIEFTKRLFQCFFDWRNEYATKKEIESAGAIIVFAFGGKDSVNDSCKSNTFLTNLTDEINKQYRTPVIAQWEIGGQLDSPIKIIWGSKKMGEYLDTFEVAHQATKKCKKLNIQKVLVVAHPHHALRCKWTLEKLGLSVKTIETKSCPYDPLSNQSWTRSAWKFIPREILARLLYLTKGYI